MGVVLLMGFGALIMGLALKSKDLATNTEVSAQKGLELNPSQLTKIIIPNGSLIKNVTSNTTQITMHINNQRGREEILIFETKSGKLIGRYLIEEDR